MIKTIKLIVDYAILYTRFSLNKNTFYKIKSLTPVVVKIHNR